MHLLVRRTLFFVGAAILFALISHLRWNLTTSLPRGLYWTTTPGPTFARGSIVVACLEPPWTAIAHERAYLASGSCPDGTRPIGKRVLAIGGDLLEPARVGLRLNGAAVPNSALCAHDTKGRSLEPYLLAQLWLVGEGSRSWDSRYFGPIRAHQVLRVAHPLIVFR